MIVAFAGLAADHTHIWMSEVTLLRTATAFGDARHATGCRESLCSAPIILGDPKHGRTLPFYVGGLSFGPGCEVRDGYPRPFLRFVAGSGSKGAADISGSVRVLSSDERKPDAAQCSGALPAPLVPWGGGVSELGLSLEVRCG